MAEKVHAADDTRHMFICVLGGTVERSASNLSSVKRLFNMHHTSLHRKRYVSKAITKSYAVI